MDDHNDIVVIAEPDQATSALYQRSLAVAFTVLVAESEEAIVRLLGTRPVAAVVIEPALFAQHGWDRLEAVSRACGIAGVPLIICSTQDERRRGRELGAAAYLVKPTLPATLLETLRQVLAAPV